MNVHELLCRFCPLFAHFLALITVSNSHHHQRLRIKTASVVLAALLSVAVALPYGGHELSLGGHGYGGHGYGHAVAVHQPTTVLTTHAQTLYAPLTQTKYGSQVNHLVPVPAPIIKGVPQPYAVPVPQPYAVPRPVGVPVPRPIPVDVPRAVPIPLVAQAAPLVTKSVVHAAPVLSHGYAGHGGYGNGLGAYGGGYGGDLGHGYGY